MGYRGKLQEREQARHLRAQAWVLADIAEELGVAKSTVSLWVRDVAFEHRPRQRARSRSPNALQQRKQAEIDRHSCSRTFRAVIGLVTALVGCETVFPG